MDDEATVETHFLLSHRMEDSKSTHRSKNVHETVSQFRDAALLQLAFATVHEDFPADLQVLLSQLCGEQEAATQNVRRDSQQERNQPRRYVMITEVVDARSISRGIQRNVHCNERERELAD